MTIEQIISVVAKNGFSFILAVLFIWYIIEDRKQNKDSIIQNNTSALNGIDGTMKALNSTIKESMVSQKENKKNIEEIQDTLRDHDKQGEKIFTACKILDYKIDNLLYNNLSSVEVKEVKLGANKILMEERERKED